MGLPAGSSGLAVVGVHAGQADQPKAVPRHAGVQHVRPGPAPSFGPSKDLSYIGTADLVLLARA